LVAGTSLARMIGTDWPLAVAAKRSAKKKGKFLIAS